ncbi:MAG: AAA family ATPase [Oscillospiraceae bacterium]|nr:AAA family ATPase [Oscillospiraceae bacterium]
MKDVTVRINNITIHNIKNVNNGSVFLNQTNDDYFGASIVGLYGQNGSGKTALVWAAELIKDALSGVKLPEDTFFYIRQQSDSAMIRAELLLTVNEREYNVLYTISIGKKDNNNVQITSEYVDFWAKAHDNHERINKTRILGIEYPLNSSDFDKCFYIPESRIIEMSGANKQIRQKLLVLQALANEKNTSFIFNDKIMDVLQSAFENPIYFKILDVLRFYGRMNMFVLNRNSDTSFNMNLLPLSMRFCSEDLIQKSDRIPVGLGKNKSNMDTFRTIENIISQIDILVKNIIPGLNVEIVSIDKELNEKAEQEIIFELVSNRNGTITPLRYESEGIKKILCILSSLIAMFNNKSIFVAIDEMDAGIFEYLLGEILDAIKKNGKGQLLFTSHNMRPLEVLESSNIYFTTTNPENKYIKFTGIKANNNLRTTLLRTIDLGGQKESIYENTSTYQIAKAFRKAGVLVNE